MQRIGSNDTVKIKICYFHPQHKNGSCHSQICATPEGSLLAYLDGMSEIHCCLWESSSEFSDRSFWTYVIIIIIIINIIIVIICST